MDNPQIIKKLPLIGWREWISIPHFNIEKIKAKIDTGARTSAIHAFNVCYEKEEGQTFIKFDVYTIPNKKKHKTSIRTLLIKKTRVKSSNGVSELRPVVLTNIKLGKYVFPIKITLTKRSNMKFRMLIGREAIRNRFVVDTGHSYIHSKKQDL